MAITGGGLTGQWLGDYQLQGVLGVGGMAEVYQARDAVINREVAVKVLPLSLAADPSYVERFRNEAQAVGALNHPNIVPVHHFGEQGPHLYLVMPLMKESLRDRLVRSAPLPVEEAVQIAVQILSGLGAAHAQGVVHRDVKPENILLDDNGVARLTDFGIARRITIQRASGGPTLAGTGLPVGTPQYMAPEQLRGEDLDQRADIYALGSVLYEMLTGLPPHMADTPYEVASLVLTANVAPPSERNPEIWPELELVMLHALNRKREDRYVDATRFAEALQDALLAHEIELIEPASVVKSSYVKFRTSQPLAKSSNGPSAGVGSVWSDGQTRDPAEPPMVPISGAPPAGSPPRWPPSNQPRDNGAGGGRPGRRVMIFALVGALLVLTACAGVAYAIGAFPPGGGTTLASATATSTQDDPPTGTLAPTTTTGPGTSTSTPAPTKTAKPGVTATSTHSSTPTNTPATSAFDSFYPNAGMGYTETLDSPQLDHPTQCGTTSGSEASFVFHNPNSTPISWQWSVSPSLSAATFSWTSSYWNNPQTGAPSGVLGPNQFIGIYVRIDCHTGPFMITMTDNRGHTYPSLTMVVPDN